jgi:DNA-binding NtrC family response regulator
MRADARCGRVLIVDDLAIHRSGLRRLLHWEGWDVDTAADGAAALALTRTTRFDVVITDLEMPAMDGPAFLRALHAEQPELPVIVTSATTSTTAAEEVMRWGAQCFLPKPLDLEGLALELGRALARRADVPPANDVITPTDDDAMEPEANA